MSAAAAKAAAAKLHRGDDADNGEHDGEDDVVMHDDEHASELCLSIDEDGDRWLTMRDGAFDTATTVAITKNGDNHFPFMPRSDMVKAAQIQRRTRASRSHSIMTKRICLA